MKNPTAKALSLAGVLPCLPSPLPVDTPPEGLEATLAGCPRVLRQLGVVLGFVAHVSKKGLDV